MMEVVIALFWAVLEILSPRTYHAPCDALFAIAAGVWAPVRLHQEHWRRPWAAVADGEVHPHWGSHHCQVRVCHSLVIPHRCWYLLTFIFSIDLAVNEGRHTMHAHTYTHTHTHTHTHMCTYTHMYMHTLVYTSCARTHTHTHTHADT